MPNGKPGDHPLTDMLAHGHHPFPDDVEAMARQLAKVKGTRPLDELSYGDWLEMEAGKNLDAHRARLRELVARYCD